MSIERGVASRLRVVLALVVAALGSLAAASAPRDRLPRLEAAPSAPSAHTLAEPAPPDLSVASTETVEGNLFRRDRRPVHTTYDVRRPEPEPEPEVVQAVPEEGAAPPRPDWTLSGVIWGARPVALFEGVEAATRIVAEGDTLGGVTVRLIDRDSVLIAHPDTMWVFAVVEPWNRRAPR